jgi:hypothetical protein
MFFRNCLIKLHINYQLDPDIRIPVSRGTVSGISSIFGGKRMKYSRISIIAIVLVVIAVAIAGCSSTSPTTPPTGGTPAATTATGAPSVTNSAPAAGSVVSGAGIFGNANYKWFEYKMTSKDMSSNMKTEVSQDTYNGKAATHTKMTMTTTTPMAATTIYDLYVDASGVSLGGHMKMISNGQTVMDQDIPPGDSSKAPKDPNADKTMQYTFVGVEPVSVPAGAYPAAMKYTATIQGMTSLYWTTPGVPMFVKMVAKSADGDITQELVGWG